MTEKGESFKIIQEYIKRLSDAGIENSANETRWLAEHFFDCTYSEIITGDIDPVPQEKLLLLEDAIRRREQREPLQYIFGWTEFCGLKIRVEPGLLIPRPETEILVELVKSETFSKYQNDVDLIKQEGLKILDLYTGTGCILLALMKNIPFADALGIDMDQKAILCARKNAAMLNLDAYFTFHTVSSTLDKLVGQKIDIVTANPPYIPSQIIPLLQPEVMHFENMLALDGGPDGLDEYRYLAKTVHRVMSSTGVLYLEAGQGQGSEVAEIFSQWEEVIIYEEQGIDIIVARYGTSDGTRVPSYLTPPPDEDEAFAIPE